MTERAYPRTDQSTESCWARINGSFGEDAALSSCHIAARCARLIGNFGASDAALREEMPTIRTSRSFPRFWVRVLKRET